LFKTPSWLVQSNIAELTGSNGLTTIIGVQNNIIGRLLGNNTLNKLFRYEANESNPYSASEMITDLRKGIWSELVSRKAIDIYRRNLQKAFVDRLITNLQTDNNPPPAALAAFGISSSNYSKTTDAISIVKMQLRSLQSEIRAAMPAYKDATSKAHLMDVNDRITEALDVKN
jgi:hypothetical protein